MKADGLLEGKQRTSVVLCYCPQAPESEEGETEALLPDTYGELVLYELPTEASSKDSWPLAFQELVVYQINSYIESIRRSGGLFYPVSVENDTCINFAGFPALAPRSGSDRDYDGVEQNAEPGPYSPSLAQTHHVTIAKQLAVPKAAQTGINAVIRPWRMTPVLPLAASRLSFETQGNELVVSCRCRPLIVHAIQVLFVYLRLLVKMVSFRTGCHKSSAAPLQVVGDDADVVLIAFSCFGGPAMPAP